MPEAPLTKEEAAQLPNIDAVFTPTHDEYARMRLVSVLRKHVIVDMREDMRRDYEGRVKPKLAKANKAPQTWREIEKAMEREASYRFYSSVRYNAQEMSFNSVQDTVERVLPEMISVARQAAAKNPAGGSLHLAPNFDVPRYVSAQDVHLIPGCFHTEHTADDVAQGAVTAWGGKVFSGAVPHRKENPGGVAQSIGQWLRGKFPDFRPRRMLDMGTSSGKNLFPYIDAYPGLEAHGIDVAAPCLRYGHAQAQYLGYPVHFHQQNAEATTFPDGHFDLITSSFFFHEVPVPVTRRIIKECFRLLAPGGIMVHMELPPEKAVSAWDNFFWNWDTEYNNEPAYTMFRAQDPAEVCERAGFSRDACFELTIPNFATFGEDRFRKFLAGEIPAPAHGSGGWFVFGARKTP
jgi:SAM-dependent methyltransferase